MSLQLACEQWSRIVEKLLREAAFSVTTTVTEPQARLHLCNEEQNFFWHLISEFYNALNEIRLREVNTFGKRGMKEITPTLKENPEIESFVESTEELEEEEELLLEEDSNDNNTIITSLRQQIWELQDERSTIAELTRKLIELSNTNSVTLDNECQDNVDDRNVVSGSVVSVKANVIEESVDDRSFSVVGTLKELLRELKQKKNVQNISVQCNEICEEANHVREIFANNNEINYADNEEVIEKQIEEIKSNNEEEEQEEQEELCEEFFESESIDGGKCNVRRALYQRILPSREITASEKMRLTLNTLRKQVDELRRGDTTSISTPLRNIATTNHSLVSTPRTRLELGTIQFNGSFLTPSSTTSIEKSNKCENIVSNNIKKKYEGDNNSSDVPKMKNVITTQTRLQKPTFRGAAIPTRRLYPCFNKTAVLLHNDQTTKAANNTLTDHKAKIDWHAKRQELKLTNANAREKIAVTPYRQHMEELRQQLETLCHAGNSDCQDNVLDQSN